MQTSSMFEALAQDELQKCMSDRNGTDVLDLLQFREPDACSAS